MAVRSSLMFSWRMTLDNPDMLPNKAPFAVSELSRSKLSALRQISAHSWELYSRASTDRSSTYSIIQRRRRPPWRVLINYVLRSTLLWRHGRTRNLKRSQGRWFGTNRDQQRRLPHSRWPYMQCTKLRSALPVRHIPCRTSFNSPKPEKSCTMLIAWDAKCGLTSRGKGVKVTSQWMAPDISRASLTAPFWVLPIVSRWLWLGYLPGVISCCSSFGDESGE